MKDKKYSGLLFFRSPIDGVERIEDSDGAYYSREVDFVDVVTVGGVTYIRKFKDGDRVISTKGGYHGVMIIDGVDEFATSMGKRLSYRVSTEDYIQGKCKTNNADDVAEDKIELVVGDWQEQKYKF